MSQVYQDLIAKLLANFLERQPLRLGAVLVHQWDVDGR
jgi:hypothetical protein